MRTRALSRVTAGQTGDALIHRLDSGSSGGQTTDSEERSSLSETSADQLSAKLNTSFLNQDEPVLMITDKRIRNLMAQTNTEKMVLENTIRDLTKQADQHRGYQEGGEDSELLIDRALQLKRNVQKGEKIEQSLLAKLTTLTTLLEMLNMEGDEAQKFRAKKCPTR